MTPEERFNQQVWEILQDIKEESLVTGRDKPVKQRFPHFQGVDIIPRERRTNIFFKLQEWGALRVRDDPFKPPIPADDEIYLDLIQPKFDEIYKKYEKACDPNTYLNDYQQKLMEGSDDGNLPQFSRTETPNDTEIDKWLASKDRWTLGKIWQVASVLNSEWQLRDQNIFKIPIQKFVKDWVDNESELEAILTNLHNRKIIEVSRKLNETPPTNDPNKPRGSIWATINDKPEIIHREDTQVEVFPKKFGYLVKKLANLVTEQPRSNGGKSKVTLNEDLKTRYDQLLDEVKSKQNSPDLKERYKQLINEIKPKVESPATSPQEDIQEQDRPTPQSKRDLRKEINRIIKARRFGKKEISFLKLLAKDFEPHTIEEISREVSTKDCKHLKGRVEKKIKGTGFSIKTIKAGGWGSKSQYQLEYLPAPASLQQ